MHTDLANHADGAAHVALIGTAAAIDIPAAANGDTPTVRTLATTFSGMPTIRFQLTDVNSTLGPALELKAAVLCAN
jgi:hypothetical protein